MEASYTYNAVVSAIHDGDTFTADMDLGMYVHFNTNIRLLGCNAFELNSPNEAGILARDVLSNIMGGIGGKIVLKTAKPDKYGGRTDAGVYLPDGTDVVAVMIKSGYAVAWNGIGVKPIPTWPIVTVP